MSNIEITVCYSGEKDIHIEPQKVVIPKKLLKNSKSIEKIKSDVQSILNLEAEFIDKLEYGESSIYEYFEPLGKKRTKKVTKIHRLKDTQ